ncbi:MAG: MAPEG family protein [Salaquimonas sp.]
MSIELKMLLYAGIVLIVQLVLQVLAGLYQNGMGYSLSPRDDPSNDSGIAGRVERAFYNMLETFPIFAALALMVQVTESWTALTAMGAQLYFWSRVFYVPTYVAGIPVLRTVIWMVSLIGICLLAWELTRVAIGA